MRKNSVGNVKMLGSARIGCAASLALALACAACGDDDNKDGGPEQTLDGGHDAGGGNIDGGADASIDAGADAGMQHGDGSTPSGDAAAGGSTGNLIINGNAEAAAGSTTAEPVDTPPWIATGEATAMAYGQSGYPSRGDADDPDPGPPDRGDNLFIGGRDDMTSTLTQTIDLSTFGSAIDRGVADYVLSAWLGGYSSQADSATLVVTFKDAHDAALTTGTLGPVTADDRTNITSLLERSATAAVPAGTRKAEVVLTLTRVDGTANDGYADDLSLVLTGVL